MQTKKGTFIALSISILLCFLYCTCDYVADSPFNEIESSEVDFNETMDAWLHAEGEAKAQLAFDFLERNPNSNHSLGFVEYLAKNYYLDQKKDPEKAIAFALAQVEKIQNPHVERSVDLFLLQLYGDAGDSRGLRKLVNKIEFERELSLEEHQTIADSAIAAEDWEMVLRQSETLLKKNTAGTIRAEAGSRRLSDAQVLATIEANSRKALQSLGRAHLHMGDAKAAIASFERAGETATYNYAGFPAWPLNDLNLFWARALLEKGDHQAAMEKISFEAVIQERKDALEILEEAMAAAGNEGGLHEFISQTKPEIARIMPEFSAYDYEGNKVYYGDLKGRVTLLAFWFPT